MASIRWAGLDATDATHLAAPWLHRSISLLLSAAMMCMLTSFRLAASRQAALGSAFPADRTNPKSTWTEAGKNIAFFAGLTLCVLAIVLIQEGCLFDPTAERR